MIKEFLTWIECAKVSERATAASALARAFILDEFSFEDRLAAEAALTLLLDDPSPKVRLALSETLSLSDRAPAQVVAALVADQPEVAAPVIMRSPLLSEEDLIDRVALGTSAVQVLVASRPTVSMAVSASIAEVGGAESCIALVRNEGADISGVSFRRMVERLGDDPVLRGVLAADKRLPPDCRHMLLTRVGDALAEAPLVKALMGAARAEKVAREACIRASTSLLGGFDSSEHAALAEHLRLRGELTSGFLVRTVVHGKIDFFGAALMVLTGQREARVRALLSDGRKPAIAALLAKAGLKQVTHEPILTGLGIWREVANGHYVAGPQEVSWHMLQAIRLLPGDRDNPASAPLVSLLKRIHLEALRENARQEAIRLAFSEENNLPRIAAAA